MSVHVANRRGPLLLLATVSALSLAAVCVVAGAGAFWTYKSIRALAAENAQLRESHARLTAELESGKLAGEAARQANAATALEVADLTTRVQNAYFAIDRQLQEGRIATAAQADELTRVSARFAEADTTLAGQSSKLDQLANRVNSFIPENPAQGVIDLGTIETSSYSLFGQRFLTSDIVRRNTFFGSAAGNVGSLGADNLALGTVALASITSGEDNTALGNFALFNHKSGTGNTAVGSGALRESVNATDVTAVGWEASRATISGVGTSAFGRRACETEKVARNSTCIGDSALRHNQGNQNIALGYRSAENFVQGDNNLFLGAGSGLNRGSGSENTYIGNWSAGFPNVSSDPATGAGAANGGDRNVGLGYYAVANFTGDDTVGIGHYALAQLAYGNGNIGLGSSAGFSLTDGDRNIFIGQDAGKNRLQKANVMNSVIIGAEAYGTADNQIVIGSESTQSIVLGGVAFSPEQLRAILANAAVSQNAH